MNKYLWTVTSMSTMPSPPAPINEYTVLAQYTGTATNGATPLATASISGSAQFAIPPSVGDKMYTPYPDLTEAQVLGWIQEEPNLVINIQANLDGQIESQLNPPITPTPTPLPWAVSPLPAEEVVSLPAEETPAPVDVAPIEVAPVDVAPVDVAPVEVV